MIEERFRLANTEAAHRRAADAFEIWLERFGNTLPLEAQCDHVGATSVPGALTKGDLDIAVRVPEEAFAATRDSLDQTHTQNLKSVRNERFAAYEAEGFACPVGVQLVVKGSRLDVFETYRRMLIDNPVLLAAYNDLKQRFDGLPMDEYRAAKSRFITEQLRL
ncbi:GrpB family protein [Maricaulaceae bacterium NA33B04]|nr:GrpB family protein [Maricaulaceae bacterium NA33B04]